MKIFLRRNSTAPCHIFYSIKYMKSHENTPETISEVADLLVPIMDNITPNRKIWIARKSREWVGGVEELWER